MANDIVTTDPAPGARDLASLALSPPRWTTETALALVNEQPSLVEAAIAKLKGELAPVPASGDAREQWKGALDERLRRLAVKVAPGMSAEQGKEWRDVMVDALADLPAMMALTAAKRAIHRPMRFMNEIEGVVREIAAEVSLSRMEAWGRLNDLKAAMERAANPAPLLTASPCDFSDEVAALVASLGSSLRARGEAVPTPARGAPLVRAAVERPAPTAADYIELGLTPAEAEQQVELQQDNGASLSRAA